MTSNLHCYFLQGSNLAGWAGPREQLVKLHNTLHLEIQRASVLVSCFTTELNETST